MSEDSESAPTSLAPEVKAARASSFGAIAADYERYRTGPTAATVEWLLPARVGTAVDLGAGTGALTRLLLPKADTVVAVEPDDRMRAVLADAVPEARALAGRGEDIPLPDASADAVLASSSWHWMDPAQTLQEVGRVLVTGGVLGIVWSGPDPDGAFITQARALLSSESTTVGGSGLAGMIDNPNGIDQTLRITPGQPFDEPESHAIYWDVPFNADELIGLLGTFSWVVLLDDASRDHLFDTARRLLRDALGVEGDVTVDVGFRADLWRARRL